MAEETISVIVPVYNVEPYLRRCVDSILAQTYRNLEVLLVDDGSTDDSGAICDEYARRDARVKAFHKENGGLSDARNFGIERADGRYLSFVDSDDFLDARMEEVLLQDLTRNGADLAIVGYQRFEQSGEIHPDALQDPVQMLTGEDAIRSVLLTEDFGVFAWNKLYKAELFQGVRYPKGQMMEDQGTTHKIFLKCKKIAYRPAELYFYYQRADSILHRRTLKFYEDKWDTGLRRYQDLRECGVCPLENDAALLNILEHCYPYLLRDARRRAQMEQFLQTFDSKALELVSPSSRRKYDLLRRNRWLYARLFLWKNGPAAEEQ